MASIGRDLNDIRAGGAGQLQERCPAPSGLIVEMLPHTLAPGVKQDALTGFGVLQLDQSDSRQAFLARISDANSDEIVSFAGSLVRLIEVAIKKVTQEKDNHPPAQDT